MKLLKLTLLIIYFLSCTVNAEERYAFLENEITLFMKNNDIPAVTVGVIENGDIQFEKAYGTYSRENIKPVTTDSLFQIGSQTKVITSLITLAAVEDGILKLDDNLDTLLPDLFSSIDKNTLQKITIDTLLSHRSGLPNYPKNVTRIDGDPMEGGYSEAQLLIALKSTILDFEPGSKFSYSNFNYALIGYILSKKTGKTYETLINEYLRKRLGITEVYSQLQADRSSVVVTPYRKDNRLIKTKPWEMGLLTPHGGLYASNHALLKLMEQQISAYQVFFKNRQIGRAHV